MTDTAIDAITDPSVITPPAPAADDQNATQPAPDADEQKTEAAETPEQVEARKESRRARSNARKAAELAEARTEARLLRERLDRIEQQAQPKQVDAEPNESDFQDYTTYAKALARWEGKQAAQAELKAEREARTSQEKQSQQSAGVENLAKAWAEREQTFQAATKDYEQVVTPFAEDELQTLSPQARSAILESDVGPALLHKLASLNESNPAEFERIAKLSPVRQIVEIGKIEFTVQMPVKRTTNAPEPASTTSGSRTASKDPAKMTQAEYEAHRKSQGARWAR